MTNVRSWRFLADGRDLPPPREDVGLVVLDPAWTPRAGVRGDVVAIRRVFGMVTSTHDLFEEALERLDTWADRTGVADRLIVEDATYWFRLRETMWHWLHERLLWRYALEAIGAVDAESFVVPAGEPALLDVTSRLGDVEVVAAFTPRQTEATPAAVTSRILRSLGRRLRSLRPGVRPSAPASHDGRATTLEARIRAIAADAAPRILVLTVPATFSPIESASDTPRDPILGPVIAALEADGFAVTSIGLGLDEGRVRDRPVLDADDRMLPESILRTRWSAAEDADRVERALASIRSAIRGLPRTAMDLGGVDLSQAFDGALAELVERVVAGDTRQRARIERALDVLHPRAVVLTQEGIRVPWLTAGRAAAVPVFAIQHGMLYPDHPGYPHVRHRGIFRARRTFVYGPYERETLLARGAYDEDEVEVSGSPRLDVSLDGDAIARAATAGDRSATGVAERSAVRRELGVREGDRLLVVSTLHLPFVQRAHLAPMLESLLGGPLPGVHLVFKQHPGEWSDGPYRELLLGLAAAGGYAAPPISVVRGLDLYRLLRAADAHLGQHSTVLTDAVAAGTPNLIAMTGAHADILGYVAAGVARPVRGIDDVRAELADPVAPSAEARARFLERHFRPGPAGVRIAASISEILASRGAAS